MLTRITLGELATRLDAELHGDPHHQVIGVTTPHGAGANDIAVLTDAELVAQAESCAARAFLVCRFHEQLGGHQLVCADPARALAQLLEIFAPQPAPVRCGVDPRAAVDPGARIDETAWIGPFTYVGPGAEIQSGALVEPFCYVGPAARVGRGCRLGPGATVMDGCTLGQGVVLGPGAVVGDQGFGFWRDDQGWHRIPSRGAVAVGDGAELGANTCVDRGTLDATRVGAGVKVDNLVQVGHNCSVMDRALLCAQVGLAGSVVLEPDTTLAGQVGVADHRRVGQGARVGAQSGVARDVPEGSDVSGYPAMEHGAWRRNSAVFARLDELVRRVRALERERKD